MCLKHARISLEAEADIDRIAAYTTNVWGERQADPWADPAMQF